MAFTDLPLISFSKWCISIAVFLISSGFAFSFGLWCRWELPGNHILLEIVSWNRLFRWTKALTFALRWEAAHSVFSYRWNDSVACIYQLQLCWSCSDASNSSKWTKLANLWLKTWQKHFHPSALQLQAHAQFCVGLTPAAQSRLNSYSQEDQLIRNGGPQQLVGSFPVTVGAVSNN